MVGLLTLLLLGLTATITKAGVIDLVDLVGQYEDEILGRSLGFGPGQDTQDTEYKNLGEVGHPVEVHGWDAQLQLGQVSAVSTNPDDDPVVFHRGPVVWDGTSFDNTNRLVGRDGPAIPVDTILTVDQFTGKVKSSLGSNLFYMPHGLTVDHEANIWVTDVGLHQVMMIPKGNSTPTLILGTRFEPGADKAHFCKPTAVAVARAGQVFIADGYCNSRVAVFDLEGHYLREMKGDWNVVHSLQLFEDEDILCIADREGERVVCVGAGLEHPQLSGAQFTDVARLGRTFGIAGRGNALLAVTGPGQTPPRGLTLDLSQDGRVVDNWGELVNPHDVALSRSGDAVYVAEIGPNRLRKFEVVAPEDDIF